MSNLHQNKIEELPESITKINELDYLWIYNNPLSYSKPQAEFLQKYVDLKIFNV